MAGGRWRRQGDHEVTHMQRAVCLKSLPSLIAKHRVVTFQIRNRGLDLFRPPSQPKLRCFTRVMRSNSHILNKQDKERKDVALMLYAPISHGAYTLSLK